MVFGILCILMWGLIPVVSVIAMSSLDHYQFLFWSSLTSFVTLGLLTVKTKQLVALQGHTVGFWLKITLLALLGTFLFYLCLYQGYQYGSKIEVLSVQYTWPAWVIVFALLAAKEKFRWHHGLVILAGMASVLLVISKGDLTELSVPNPVVLIWVLCGSAAFALFSVLSKYVDMPALPLNMVYFAVATVASLLAMLLNSSFVLPNTDSVLSVMINGVVVNGISYYFWLNALKQTKAEYLSLLTFMTPLVSVCYLMVFFSEPFYVAYFVAFGLVAVSGVASVLQNKKM